MHVNLGGYHVHDIEFSAAFDIVDTKVGKDLSEAIYAYPNNTFKFDTVPNLGVKVERGMTHDGLGKYLSQILKKAPGPTADIVKILKDTGTDVVINYLPVGSEMATKWYVNRSWKPAAAWSTPSLYSSPRQNTGASGLPSGTCPSSAMISKASWVPPSCTAS
jgi:myo-inositol-1-phosphate synthase